MKNYQKCPNCSHKNPLHELNCENCSFILHNRIVNIDFWNIFFRLIEAPSNAMRGIIQSEHKNFISYIIFFAAGKLIAICSFAYLHFSGELLYDHLFIIAAIGIIIGMTTIFSSLLNLLVFRGKNYRLRFKDTFAVLVYSLTPLMIGMVVLVPLEFIVFGKYLYSLNPQPFEIKPVLAYTFAALEGVLILWSALLTFKAVRVISAGIITPIISALLFQASLYTSFYFVFPLYKIILDI